jgi:hypothetical protein
VIQLGDKVKDRVTSLTGIAIARTEWLNGCVRFVVQPQELKDGKPVDMVTFDIEDLEVVEAGVIIAKQKVATVPPRAKTGGPMPSTPRTGH